MPEEGLGINKGGGGKKPDPRSFHYSRKKIEKRALPPSSVSTKLWGRKHGDREKGGGLAVLIKSEPQGDGSLNEKMR